jgi:hypothetical protein
MNLMEGQNIFADDGVTKVVHTDEYDGSYSQMLEDVVAACLELQAAKRPTLAYLLSMTREGLRRWEKGNTRFNGQDVPAFANMTFPDEEFKIGDEAPERMGGPNPKKRKAEEDSNPLDFLRPLDQAADLVAVFAVKQILCRTAQQK